MKQPNKEHTSETYRLSMDEEPDSYRTYVEVEGLGVMPVCVEKTADGQTRVSNVKTGVAGLGDGVVDAMEKFLAAMEEYVDAYRRTPSEPRVLGCCRFTPSPFCSDGCKFR